MSKDPGFIFYPGDYLRDTQTLSEKSQVAYDRIICEHMRNICISKQQLKFFTKRLNEEETEELMFVLNEVEGGFQIEWVAESINKRRAYSESRRKNRGSKNEKHMLNISKTYEKHMENEIENEIENKDKGVVRGKCLMKNSGVTIKDVKADFLKRDDLVNANPNYYYNAAMDWSDAKGEMRKDWLATVRTFARRDIEQGKLKLKKTVTQNPVNAAAPVREDYGKRSENDVPMPDRLKKRLSTIGKHEV